VVGGVPAKIIKDIDGSTIRANRTIIHSTKEVNL
jgi:hypothetical protein